MPRNPRFWNASGEKRRCWRGLQHPHIVRYYDIIESGDVVFILTDYIAGRTLQSVLRQREEPLTPLESLTYLQSAGGGAAFRAP